MKAHDMGNSQVDQEALRDEFEKLRDHCVIIRRDYNTYNHLFFSGSDELLIKAAGQFFNDIAEILNRDWILQVCKLMDPPVAIVKGGERETISIALINLRLEEAGILNAEIKELSKEILAYGQKLIPARNKRIAHLDKEYAFSEEVLGGTSEQELADFLTNMQRYCDEVGRATDAGPSDFSCSSCAGDVLDLIKIIKTHYECPNREIACSPK